MIISDDHLNDIVLGINRQLSLAGIELDSDLLGDLNDTLTSFFYHKCDINVEETVSFDKLEGDQWTAWMKLARQAQSDRNDNPELISPEDTEREAKHLYSLHGGIIPIPF